MHDEVSRSSSVANKWIRCFSPKSPLCRGLIVGGLLAGIALAIVIALWLTTPKTTTIPTTSATTSYETTTTMAIVGESRNSVSQVLEFSLSFVEGE